MNWIKAISTSTQVGWWEIMLSDLCLMADGSTEAEMLDNLARSLNFHYITAQEAGVTPFVSLLRDPNCPRPQWDPAAPTKLRKLNISDEVSRALAAVLHAPNYQQPSLAMKETSNDGAQAA